MGISHTVPRAANISNQDDRLVNNDNGFCQVCQLRLKSHLCTFRWRLYFRIVCPWKTHKIWKACSDTGYLNFILIHDKIFQFNELQFTNVILLGYILFNKDKITKITAYQLSLFPASTNAPECILKVNALLFVSTVQTELRQCDLIVHFGHPGKMATLKRLDAGQIPPSPALTPEE